MFLVHSFIVSATVVLANLSSKYKGREDQLINWVRARRINDPTIPIDTPAARATEPHD